MLTPETCVSSQYSNVIGDMHTTIAQQAIQYCKAARALMSYFFTTTPAIIFPKIPPGTAMAPKVKGHIKVMQTAPIN